MSLRKKSILVTGANGFLGSVIAQQLTKAGHVVRVTGRQIQSKSGWPNYRSVDLCSLPPDSALTAGIETVIHVAGLAHQFGARQPREEAYFDVNTKATERLLRASQLSGVRHFVFVSSVSVYGNQGSQQAFAEGDACQPQGPYAKSKLSAEKIVTQLADAAGIDWTILRPATIYGAGDIGNIQRLMRAIDRRRFLWIGAGSNRKSLVHVSDAARACVLVADRDQEANGKVWNVTAGDYTMKDVVNCLAQELGRRTLPVRLPGQLLVRLSDLVRRLSGGQGVAQRVHSTLEKWLRDDTYDATCLRRQLEWEPLVSLEEGLADEVRWYRQRESSGAKKSSFTWGSHQLTA